jgi:membrane-associated protease RseP (regulator of RpoE activity)
VLILVFLSAHEFGHYFAAKAHGVDATLPYYIPFPLFFGTMGAVIRTRSPVMSRTALFDIGVAGPLAGFVVAFVYLVIGIATVPGPEWLYTIHPEYRALASFPDYGIHFGDFLLFAALRELLLSPGQWFPGMNEIYHDPFLAVGWFGMFVTSLNMIPAGQLDGGHVVYAMFGQKQHVISKWVVRFLIFAGVGAIAGLVLDLTRQYNPDPIYQFLVSIFGPPLEFVDAHAGWWFFGWPGWLFWVLILKVFIGVKHPDTPDQTPLDRRRMIIGWVALIILVLTFSFAGLYEIENPNVQEPADAPVPEQQVI